MQLTYNSSDEKYDQSKTVVWVGLQCVGSNLVRLETTDGTNGKDVERRGE